MANNKTSLMTFDSFYPEARPLRNHFEERFGDPRGGRSDRFVWDYWNVPDQYTALRTPAYHFFPKKMYDAFHNHLVWWGRRHLGCHDISPPWMSCYIDGCKQEFHGDLPHGPWAFVYSLTPWKTRKFQGGETILIKEEILSYWQTRGLANGKQGQSLAQKGTEKADIIREIPAIFNRLTVFDPRIPHGVREVRGPRDVLDGRLVIHGWFVQPRPFVEGPLPTKQLQSAINDLSGMLGDLIQAGLEVSGMVSLFFQVAPTGAVSGIKVLSKSIRHPGGNEKIEAALVRHIIKHLANVCFGKQRGRSTVTLPLVFETAL